MIWNSNGNIDALLLDGADTVVVQLGQFGRERDGPIQVGQRFAWAA